MSQSSKTNKTISVITILLVVIAVVICVALLLFGTKKVWNIIAWVFALIAMIPSFIYACNGYRKDVAVYYKAFMGLYSLNALISLISSIATTISVGGIYSSYLSAVSHFIVLVGCLILIFAKDFGKQKSMITAFCILAAQLFSFVRMLVKFCDVLNIVLGASMNLIVAIVICLFVYAKYLDKAARGTK